MVYQLNFNVHVYGSRAIVFHKQIIMIYTSYIVLWPGNDFFNKHDAAVTEDLFVVL